MESGAIILYDDTCYNVLERLLELCQALHTILNDSIDPSRDLRVLILRLKQKLSFNSLYMQKEKLRMGHHIIQHASRKEQVAYRFDNFRYSIPIECNLLEEEEEEEGLNKNTNDSQQRSEVYTILLCPE